MKKQNVAQLAREAGLEPSLIYNRMSRGWTLAKALKEPPRKRGKKAESSARERKEEFPKKISDAQLDHHHKDTITLAAVTLTAIVLIIFLSVMTA
jgi:hypothetical protein